MATAKAKSPSPRKPNHGTPHIPHARAVEPAAAAGVNRAAKGVSTRDAIVKAALSQAVSVGLEGISIGGLAESLGLSKSGLFAHFKSKEALQMAVFDEAVERFAQRVILPSLTKPRGEPRVWALFENNLAWIENSGFGGGCFFMALEQEYDDRPGPIRDRLIKSQRDWRDVFARAVALAVQEKHFANTVDPAQFAFEALGISAAFQQAHKLLADPLARKHVVYAFDRLLDEARHKKRG